jgi:hypothetical protein
MNQVTLTTDETISVLSACVTVLADSLRPESGEDEKENTKNLFKGTAKIAQGIGMDLETLAAFSAHVAGIPNPSVMKFFEELGK